MGAWLYCMYYNFAAGSFHTQKLCSGLYSTEVGFYSKQWKNRFLSHHLGHSLSVACQFVHAALEHDDVRKQATIWNRLTINHKALQLGIQILWRFQRKFTANSLLSLLVIELYKSSAIAEKADRCVCLLLADRRHPYILWLRILKTYR